MDYEALQGLIVDRLQVFTAAGVEVVRLPQNTAELKQMITGGVRFTVVYAGSEYEKAQSTSEVSQSEEVFFQVLIESSALYGPFGALSMVSLLKKAIIGFKIPGYKRFQLSKHHTIGQPEAENTKGFWQYNVVFFTSTLNVQDPDEEIIVLLKQLKYKDVPDGEINMIPDLN